MIALMGLYHRRICWEITDRYMNNKVVIIGDHNFPNIDYDGQNTKGLNVAEFVKCAQEGFLK